MLHNTPVIMPGANGDHLGLIDLDLVYHRTGWQVMDAHAELRPALDQEDKNLLGMTRPLHDATRRHLAQSVGQSPLPLHSYFGHVAPSPASAIVAAAKRHGLRKLLPPDVDLPVLSSVAPGKLGGRGGPANYVDIPAGELSLRHIHDLCFFPNRLAAVVVTGAQLEDWLEMSAGIYNHIDPEKTDHALIDPEYPPNGSDVIYGIEYELDLSQPARFDGGGELVNPKNRRVTRITFRGQTVQPNDRFIVALSSHRANGGGNVRALEIAEHLAIPRTLIRDVLRDYLTAGQFPEQPYQQTVQFKSLGGTDVLVRTGPGALRFLPEIENMQPAVSGIDETGFLTLRLSL